MFTAFSANNRMQLSVSPSRSFVDEVNSDQAFEIPTKHSEADFARL
jgi:hypothetical protein